MCYNAKGVDPNGILTPVSSSQFIEMAELTLKWQLYIASDSNKKQFHSNYLCWFVHYLQCQMPKVCQKQPLFCNYVVQMSTKTKIVDNSWGQGSIRNPKGLATTRRVLNQ